MAESILSRIPEDLEEQTEDVVLASCDQLGFHVEQHRGVARYSVEFGNRARVESLPGVPGGSNWLGTFDRQEAVEHESIDFYASGHPLIEGLLAHIEESPRGRVTLIHASPAEEGEQGFGPPGDLPRTARASSRWRSTARATSGRTGPSD